MVRSSLLCHCFPQVWDTNDPPAPHANMSHNQVSPLLLPLEPRKPLPTLCLSPLQVVKHLPKAHILACAPSNSGADLLCQRLRVHLPSSIYRLLAPSRDIRMVPEDIKVPGEVCRGEGWQVPGGSGWMLGPGNGVTWILILAVGAWVGQDPSLAFRFPGK